MLPLVVTKTAKYEEPPSPFIKIPREKTDIWTIQSYIRERSSSMLLEKTPGSSTSESCSSFKSETATRIQTPSVPPVATVHFSASHGMDLYQQQKENRFLNYMQLVKKIKQGSSKPVQDESNKSTKVYSFQVYVPMQHVGNGFKYSVQLPENKIRKRNKKRISKKKTKHAMPLQTISNKHSSATLDSTDTKHNKHEKLTLTLDRKSILNKSADNNNKENLHLPHINSQISQISETSVNYPRNSNSESRYDLDDLDDDLNTPGSMTLPRIAELLRDEGVKDSYITQQMVQRNNYHKENSMTINRRQKVLSKQTMQVPVSDVIPPDLPTETRPKYRELLTSKIQDWVSTIKHKREFISQWRPAANTSSPSNLHDLNITKVKYHS